MTSLAGKRIGLNGTCYNERPSGARQRFVGLYGQVIKANPSTEFFIYDAADAAISSAFAGAVNVVARSTPIASAGRLRKAVASVGFWQRKLLADKLDLFEQFNLPLVKAPACPTVLTIHDVRDANSHVLPLRQLYRFTWRNALARVDHVITVSRTMKSEIEALSAYVPVTVIYNGINQSFPCILNRTDHRNRCTQLLAVGHLEPRKNYLTLLNAVARIKKRKRDVHLTVVGRDGGSKDAIEAAIHANDLTADITLRSDVSNTELANLYRACDMVVFPSLYEGFGIPLIEAMAAHRPIITSDIGVFREITEDQGCYFPPLDPEAMASSILQLVDQPLLADRLVEYGTARISDFRYEHLATQVTELYRQLIS